MKKSFDWFKIIIILILETFWLNYSSGSAAFINVESHDLVLASSSMLFALASLAKAFLYWLWFQTGGWSWISLWSANYISGTAYEGRFQALMQPLCFDLLHAHHAWLGLVLWLANGVASWPWLLQLQFFWIHLLFKHLGARNQNAIHIAIYFIASVRCEVRFLRRYGRGLANSRHLGHACISSLGEGHFLIATQELVLTLYYLAYH